MKKVIILFSLLLLTGISHAGDVSCQVDVLKPKMNASTLQEEISKPGEITVAEARLRLSNESREEQQDQETAQTDNEELPAETAKKESGLGNMFDILIPAKLRNPVRQ